MPTSMSRVIEYNHERSHALELNVIGTLSATVCPSYNEPIYSPYKMLACITDQSALLS